MRSLRIAVLLALCASTAFAETTRNDDSCDVTTLPAATLLLPYFEVDLRAPADVALTTLVTVVNTSSTPQIASVTLWTDWAYPVLTFDIFLTGYDVQPVNLRELLVVGQIARTSNAAAPGSRSRANAGNPGFLPDAQFACANIPTEVPAQALAEVQAALTVGRTPACADERVGGAHVNAIGYATIDVVATCNSELPTGTRYWDELLYDNVLTGDWMLVEPNRATGNYAAGESLVHIRAVPEGGPAAAVADGVVATSLPYTFYDRFLGQQRLRDRRQPLPSAFSARYIEGGPTGFVTHYLIWREGVTNASATCGFYAQNGRMATRDVVRFDERENPTTFAPQVVIPTFPPLDLTLPATSRTSTSSASYPPLTSGDVAGWMFLSVDNLGSIHYSAPEGRNFVVNGDRRPMTGPRSSQNWVAPMLFAEGRYSASFAATPLANGCSPALPSATIAPGANVTP